MQTSFHFSPISLRGLVIWLLAALFFLYEFFLRTFIGSVAHQIIPDLKLNAETFAIIGAAYCISYGVMQVPVGILTDKFGIRIILTSATIICAGATFLFAHSSGFSSALISRLLMGFGSSFAFVCLLIIAATWLPKRYFGFFAGASQFIGTIGPILAGGPLVSMMIASHQSWRNMLTLVSVLGTALAMVILVVVKNRPKERQQGPAFSKQLSPLKHRLIKLIKNLQVWHVSIYSATVYVSMAFLGVIWGTEYLQAQGLSQTRAADIISLAWLSYAISCPLLGALSDLMQRRKPILIICALLGILISLAITYLPLTHIKLGYALLFIGLGIAASGQSIGFATIAEHTDLGTKGTALGFNNGMISLFIAIIEPLASYFIYWSARSHTGHLTVSDFRVGFIFMPILYCIAFSTAVFFVKETYCRN